MEYDRVTCRRLTGANRHLSGVPHALSALQRGRAHQLEICPALDRANPAAAVAVALHVAEGHRGRNAGARGVVCNEGKSSVERRVCVLQVELKSSYRSRLSYFSECFFASSASTDTRERKRCSKNGAFHFRILTRRKNCLSLKAFASLGSIRRVGVRASTPFLPDSLSRGVVGAGNT